MKLIDLLVKELPQQGGWPAGATECYWHKGFDVAHFYDATGDGAAEPIDVDGVEWCGSDGYDVKVTKSQYDSALAASDGWIEWSGGECPVDSDAIVDVRYRIPKPYQYINYNDRAGDFDWEHIGSNADIIAYRLYNPEINSRANDDRLEQDLNECIGHGVTSEWDGEGLPPVGCECEVKRAIDWVKCKILFISEVHVVLMSDEECCWNTCACQFRPLRSESERERDAAINDMLTIIDCNGVNPKNSAIQIYEAIAAGKIPGIKLEGK